MKRHTPLILVDLTRRQRQSRTRTSLSLAISRVRFRMAKTNKAVHGTKGKNYSGGASSVPASAQKEGHELPELHENHDLTGHLGGFHGGSAFPEHFTQEDRDPVDD